MPNPTETERRVAGVERSEPPESRRTGGSLRSTPGTRELEESDAEKRDAEPSRRELLRGWARYVVLGALTGFSAGLLVRGAGASGRGRCSPSACCRQCPGFSQCNLPRAVSAREAKKR